MRIFEGDMVNVPMNVKDNTQSGNGGRSNSTLCLLGVNRDVTSFPLTRRDSVSRYYRFQPVVNALARLVLWRSQRGRGSGRLDNAF